MEQLSNDTVITESIISKMLEAAQKAGDDVNSLDYKVFKNLEVLYRMCLQCDQMNNPTTGAIRTHRVVRIRKFIPNSVVKLLKDMNTDAPYLYDRCFLSGMFMIVPCVVVSKEHTESVMAFKMGNTKVYDHKRSQILKDMGIDIVESTIHINSNGSCIMLEKSILTDWVWSGSQYYMLEVE